MDTSIPIVALTMTASAVQHRALPIARSAGRLGIPVHAVAVGRAGPTAASRYLQRPVTLPADASEDQVRDALLELGRRLGRSVLVPLEDASTVFVDDNADALSEYFAFPRRPPGTSRLLASKRELHLLCERLGLPSPRAAFPADGAAALAEAGRLGYPVVAKRIDAWLVCN
ncbi:MAG TPA: hypothetical protein VEQ61_10495, partial [Thermoleophilaceae bacterium]|nr:hypothetical protein [Thermoleophilaceae bacterium]